MNTPPRTGTLRLLPLAAALAAVLLLPSCRWNIGERIRAASAVYVGADTSRPVDGKSYHVPGRAYLESYAYAPEVSYRMEPDWVESWFIAWPHRSPFDITPTGRMVLMRYGVDGVERVDSLPEGAVPYLTNTQEEVKKLLMRTPPPMPARELGDWDSPRATRGTLGARLAAAPFDYLIDPLLSVVTTPIYSAGIVLVISTGALELYKDRPAFLRQSQQAADGAAPAADETK